MDFEENYTTYQIEKTIDWIGLVEIRETMFRKRKHINDWTSITGLWIRGITYFRKTEANFINLYSL
jgi:hypothetical protein